MTVVSSFTALHSQSQVATGKDNMTGKQLQDILKAEGSVNYECFWCKDTSDSLEHLPFYECMICYQRQPVDAKRDT